MRGGSPRATARGGPWARFVTGGAVWEAVFGNRRPVEVEIGPGRGDVMAAFAAAHPDVNFFGIERSAGLAAALDARARALGLDNVRAIGGDARCIVATCIPDASVSAYHVYFPDPWPKTRHRERRLFHDGAFAAALQRTLVASGRVYLATDVPGLLEAMRRTLLRARFREATGEHPPLDRPRTKFERKYAGAGTWAATFVSP